MYQAIRPTTWIRRGPKPHSLQAKSGEVEGAKQFPPKKKPRIGPPKLVKCPGPGRKHTRN